MIVADLMIDFY